MAPQRLAAILAVCLFLSFSLSFAGCLQFGQSAPNPNLSLARASSPTDTCVKACRSVRALGQNLDSGPCLLNPIPDEPRWVCDIAHLPRQAVDDEPANQCSVYADGKADRFVELTPECELIRTG